MGNSAISIIVPVYNNEDYLKKCLDSILNQSLNDIEIIMVNDGSTDKSGDICDNYAIQDNRVKVIHQEKLGVSAARNAGVNNADGEYIGFVDGDDYIDKFMFEKMYKASKDYGSDISVCRLGREIYGKLINQTNEEYDLELDNEKAMEELFKGVLYRFSLCNKLFHKSCFKGITFPVGRIHEDLSTTYKLFANANKAVYLNYVGYIYVKQKESILTKSYYEKRLDAFIAWDEIIEFMKQKYPQLFDTVNCCFTYSCVDHFYYILNQVEDKKHRKVFLLSIQSSVRNNYNDTKENNALSRFYKGMALLINYNMSLLVFAHKFKKVISNK